MAKTFRDIITECENYEHSQEHYELMKECSELQLMEQYMQNQEFMAENAQLITESTGIEPSYFGEAEEASTVEEVGKAAKKKGMGIMVTIRRGAAKIFNTLCNLLKKIASKFDKYMADCRELKKKIADHGDFTKAEAEQIDKILKDYWKSAFDGKYELVQKQPHANKLKFKCSELANSGNAVDMALEKQIQSDLAGVLSDDTVYVAVDIVKHDGVGALPCHIIKVAGTSLATGSASQINGTIAMMEKEWQTVKKKGLAINVNPTGINQDIQDLNNVYNAVQQAITKAEGAEDGEGVDAEKASAANKAYSMLQSVCAESMQVYSGLNRYRGGVYSELMAFMIKLEGDKKYGSPNKKGEKKEEKPAEEAPAEEKK